MLTGPRPIHKTAPKKNLAGSAYQQKGYSENFLIKIFNAIKSLFNKIT